MASEKLFIEYRQAEGDYAIRKANSQRASKTAPTQQQAIEAAKEMYPNAALHVERVRNTKAGGRDKWRKI